MIEILVALAIGVLSMVVMLQIFSNSEGQKRTATGGADAQTNGATALYLIERDVKMAGWALDANQYLGTQPPSAPWPATPSPAAPGCTTVFSFCDGTAACGAGTETGNNFSFAAVLIKDGAPGLPDDPDQITVRYFGSPALDTYEVPTSASYIGDAPPALSVSNNKTCHLGDLALISDSTVPAGALAGTCTILQVTTEPVLPVGTANPQILHAGSAFNNAGNWPPAGSTPTSNARVTCFRHPSDGPIFKRVFWIDANWNLVKKSDNTLLNPDGTSAAPVANEVVASGIVDMQAQYGVAADQTQNIISWVKAIAPWDKPKPMPAVWGATTAGRLQNITAVRIALLARSAQFEAPDPVRGCIATTDAMVAAWPQWTNGLAPAAPVFKIPAATPDWKCYRYKVFQTLVPLRNVIWGNI